jgi:hypothetical protein
MSISWFYISFATREGHRGSTVVQAADAAGALVEANRRGLNPGGEAQIVPVPPANNEHPDIIPLRNRLASKAELMARGAIRGGYHENSEVVCEQCNTEKS